MAKDVIYEWKIQVSIFGNSLILKQLGFAVGVPFGLLILFLISIKAYYGIMMVLAMLIFAFLLIFIFYGGKYQVEYLLDKKGVSCGYQENQRKKNRLINRLLLIMAFLGGKPTYGGIGMLADSRQKEFIPWQHIKNVKFIDKKKTIQLKGRFSENITLFCENHEYEQIKIIIQKYAKI